jgi:pimeloyl-ACP methyl ester carboxylesterase
MEQLDRIAAGLAAGDAPPCELLKLADCGHTPQRDQPGAVSAAIARLYLSCRGPTP